MLKSGETTSDTRGCSQVTPEIGVTSTPVIDRTRGANGVVYVVAMSKDGSGNYHQRLHALDLALGTELFGGPVEIQATYPGTGDNSNGTNVIFDPGQYKERAGLLLMNGVVYTGWASHCDIRPYTGWIIGYNAVDPGADQRAERDSERQRRRDLDGRRGPGRRQLRATSISSTPTATSTPP